MNAKVESTGSGPAPDWHTELQGPDDDVPVQVAHLGRYELAAMATISRPGDADWDENLGWSWLVRCIGIGVVGLGHAASLEEAQRAAETRATTLSDTLRLPTTETAT